MFLGLNLNDISKLYYDFTNLDVSYKFIFTLFAGLIVFLYKAFSTMYSEDEKQYLLLEVKSGELLGKLKAAIAIYQKSDRARADQRYSN